jgi:hypothetical protein
MIELLARTGARDRHDLQGHDLGRPIADAGTTALWLQHSA